MINWKDYQKKAITTAIYPKKYKGVYPVYGLVDEAVEFYDKPGDIIELGKCLWYFALICEDFDFDIDGLYEDALSLGYFEYHDNYVASIDMIRSAAKICGITKKWLRDEKGQEPSYDKLVEIEYELTKFLTAVLYICSDMKWTWKKVAQANLDKLSGRKKGAYGN